MSRLATLVAVLSMLFTAGGCDSHTERGPASVTGPSGDTVALSVVRAPTPRLEVPRYDTSGTYPQVRNGTLDLGAVNRSLRAAVLADQRAYAPHARREKAQAPPSGLATRYRGVYRTGVARRLVSASTVVVSALIPLTAELFPGESGGDGWLGVTVRVPSGERVAISGLFSRPAEALRVLRNHLRGPAIATCIRLHPSDFRPTLANYRQFALTPRGLAIGFREDDACYRLVATVRYEILRPYLSRLGAKLVAGVRPPA
jgi:hypothetical protein